MRITTSRFLQDSFRVLAESKRQEEGTRIAMPRAFLAIVQACSSFTKIRPSVRDTALWVMLSGL
ncbi:hypothetical protein ANAPC5_01482 [Anaplasma phagocytophilum]|nr:hypothetical protein ANAPC5_01482 [Anaplasma phagocytophilum]